MTRATQTGRQSAYATHDQHLRSGVALWVAVETDGQWETESREVCLGNYTNAVQAPGSPRRVLLRHGRLNPLSRSAGVPGNSAINRQDRSARTGAPGQERRRRTLSYVPAIADRQRIKGGDMGGRDSAGQCHRASAGRRVARGVLCARLQPVTRPALQVGSVQSHLTPHPVPSALVRFQSITVYPLLLEFVQKCALINFREKSLR